MARVNPGVTGRQRNAGGGWRVGAWQWVNPYPGLSKPDALVHLFLEGLGVPFSYRKFDGHAPQYTELMPGSAPEFTLSEYKSVILIQGTYFSTLPGVLDQAGLTQALLEHDGWKVAVLWDIDIIIDVQEAVLKALPELASAPIKGPPKADAQLFPRENMDRRRAMARTLSFARRRWLDNEAEWGPRGQRRTPTRGGRRDRRRVDRTTRPDNTYERSLLRGQFRTIRTQRGIAKPRVDYWRSAPR